MCCKAAPNYPCKPVELPQPTCESRGSMELNPWRQHAKFVSIDRSRRVLLVCRKCSTGSRRPATPSVNIDFAVDAARETVDDRPAASQIRC